MREKDAGRGEGRRERQSTPSGQWSQSRQTDGRRAVVVGKAGCGECGWTERPPSVGDGGDRQTVVLRGKGGAQGLADSCP